MKVLFLIATSLLLMLSGCASTTVTPTPHSAASVNATKTAVFFYEGDIKKPFAVVGTIHHLDPGKYQHVALVDVMPLLIDKAVALKADAIIIDSQTTVISGIFSRGIEVRARAITY